MPLLQHALSLGPMDNNTYILVCSDTQEAAVIDVGFEPDAVIASLRKLGVKVTLLLNTHAHYDHIAGMREVQAAVGGEWWLHPLDRAMLDTFKEQGGMFGLPRFEVPEGVNDLHDGQRILVGAQELEVLHTPGHSPGHVSFHAGNDLWSADVLFAGSIGRTDLEGGSWPDLERSIRTRLFPLGDATRVHTGHGPQTTIGQERLTNPFVGEGASYS